MTSLKWFFLYVAIFIAFICPFQISLIFRKMLLEIQRWWWHWTDSIHERQSSFPPAAIDNFDFNSNLNGFHWKLSLCRCRLQCIAYHMHWMKITQVKTIWAKMSKAIENYEFVIKAFEIPLCAFPTGHTHREIHSHCFQCLLECFHLIICFVILCFHIYFFPHQRTSLPAQTNTHIVLQNPNRFK